MENKKQRPLKEKVKYSYLEKRFSIFRFSYYKLGDKFSIRLEISKGWDK